METFIPAMPFITNPRFHEEREKHIAAVRNLIQAGEIDPPLVPILLGLNAVSCCFPVQSCYGHFVHQFEPEEKNLARLAPYKGTVTDVRYRLAYIALCIEESDEGVSLCHELRDIPRLCPSCIQFGSARWFWERLANTYVLQVEPARAKEKNSLLLTYEEALVLEGVRDRFFAYLSEVITAHARRERERVSFH